MSNLMDNFVMLLNVLIGYLISVLKLIMGNPFYMVLSVVGIFLLGREFKIGKLISFKG